MRLRLMVGILVLLVGVVWIGQGLGYLRSSSFMVDDIRWSVIGAVMVAVGAALAISARRVGRH
jgi:ABC-type cobalamin transport system permease subunit